MLSEKLKFRSILVDRNAVCHLIDVRFAHPNEVFPPAMWHNFSYPTIRTRHSSKIWNLLHKMYVEACFELCQENMWPDVRSWWKKFNITDYISDIHGSLGAIKLLTIIASRSKPWPLVVNEVALFLPYVINLQMLLFRFLPYVMILQMLLFRSSSQRQRLAWYATTWGGGTDWRTRQGTDWWGSCEVIREENMSRGAQISGLKVAGLLNFLLWHIICVSSV